MIDRDSISHGTPEAYRECIHDALYGVMVHAEIGMTYAAVGNDAGLEYSVRCLVGYARAIVSTVKDLKVMKETNRA